MRHALKFAVLPTVLFLGSVAHATDWSTQDYDLHIGDFNGDSRDDVLYIAKAADKGSGIVLADQSGNLALSHQVWASNYLNIPWFGNLYRAVVADFNGDTRDDILLQKQSPGDHYLLLANADGKFLGISQAIGNTTMNLAWSADQHIIVPGDFNGDLRADLFLQGRGASSTHAIVMPDTNGQFTGSSAYQTWTDGYLGFQWSWSKALVYAGNFNGDLRADLFVQAKPDILIIDYDIPFPVPRYRPNSYGIVLALDPAGGVVFRSGSVNQYWSRNHLGLDWSPTASNILIGDFNDDGKDDIFLQARVSGRQNAVLFASAAAQFQSTGSISDTTILNSWTGDNYRFLAGDFNADGRRGLYAQATGAGGTNYVAQDITIQGATTVHDPSSVVPVTPGTAVGAIPGEFSVDPSGGAGYRVPIAVPPGVAGVDPELAIAYSSRGGNGLLGIGWSIAGLSVISRCPSTVAQDGSADGVDFDASDRYCLDGGRLIVIGSGVAYGAVGAEYRTEFESFQKVLSSGPTAGDPSSFTVWDKSGLVREYGSTPDSRIEAQGKTQATVWAVKRIRDRFNNLIEFNYAEDTSNGSFRPTSIRYGNSTSGTTINTEVGKVEFTYETRSDVESGYFVGSLTGQTQRLKKISVWARPDQVAVGASAATAKVREYYLVYEYSPTSNLSHLKQVIQCDGGSGGSQKCVGATQFQWQHGYRGFSESINTNATLGSTVDLKMFDVNNDGRTDYVYKKNGRWYFKVLGMQGNEFDSGRTAVASDYAIAMDYDSDGFGDLLQKSASPGTMLEVLRGSDAGLSAPTSTTALNAALSQFSLKTAVGDVDADGRQDLIYGDTWGQIITYRGSASGFATPVNSSINVADSPVSEGSVDAIQTSTPGASMPALSVINYNGDGLDDLLVRVKLCTHFSGELCGGYFTQWQLLAANNNGSFTVVWRKTTDLLKLKITDANGDGLTDLLFFDSATAKWVLWVNHGALIAANPLGPFTQDWSSSGVTYVQREDVNWAYFQQLIYGQPSASPVTVSLTEDLLRQAQIFDYNRDGRADVLIPVSGTWRVQQSTGSGYDGLLLDTGRTASFADRTMVLDNLSDGLPDLMYPDGTTSGSVFRIYYQRGPVVAGLIDKITDGFGATTQIQYSTLNEYESNGVNPIAYKGRTNLVETGGPPSFPIVHFAAPIPIVHKFAADNGRPGNGAVLTTYEYRGMKAHKQGRGMLGFSEVRSWNDNSAIQTINKFAQTEPYIGMVLEAEQKFPDQILYNNQLPGDTAPNLRLQYESSCDASPVYCPPISAPPVTHVTGNTVVKTTNVLRSRLTSNGTKLPFLGKSTELVYPLVQSGSQPAAFKRTVTDYLDIDAGETTNAYDDDGNARRIRVTVDHAGNPAANANDISIVDTKNYYAAPDYGNWCLGRVIQTTVEHTRPSYGNGNQTPLAQMRESAFEYFTGASSFSCLLRKEHTGTASLRLTKEYAYDGFGNRTVETISGADIGTSTVTTVFDAQGQFPATVTNALSHQESQQWNTKFGVQKQLTGPNGLVTSWQHDAFGRKTLETPPSPNLALYTQTSFHWCPGICTDSSAVYAVKTSSSDGSYAWVEFDRLGREVRTRRLGFDGREFYSDKFYDPLGREYLVSAPYYAGNSQCWTFRKFDQLGRVFDEWSASSQNECISGAYAFDAALPSGGRRNQYQYDELNLQGIVTTALTNAGDTTARTVTKTANPMGRVRFVKDIIDGSTTYVTEYDYDAAGNNSWVRDHAGNQTHLAYNVRGFKIQMIDPDMGTWTYVYNVLGQLKQQTDAKAQVTLLDYDLLGRPTTRTEKLAGGATETTSQWFYDENSGAQPSKGKLTRVTGANGFEEHYTYDAYGRLDHARRKVDGAWYWISTAYDSLNRVDTIKYPNSLSSSSDTSAGPDSDRFRVKQNYNARGYLESVQEIQSGGALGTVYWRATSIDDLGNVTGESLGNGLVTSRTIDRATGFVSDIETGATIVTDVQDLHFVWDKAGNLTERIDYKINSGAGIKEQFTYDKLYRVKDLKFFATSGGSTPTATETMSYDTIGNITGKGTQYTAYNYTVATGCTNTHAQPHAVRRLTANGVQRTYCYDPNGNVGSVSGSNAAYTGVTWHVSNLAKRITRSANEWAEFSYDLSRARYKQVAQLNASTSETTVYVGSIYEKRTTGANVEHVHYIRDGNDTVAVFKRKSSGVLQTRYLHRDHLGSVVATTTDSGAVEERFSFDPWGKRRDGLTVNNTVGANHWTGPSAGSFMTLASSFTHRGYTGHEHIDHIGLVNMNGRVYDPEIGRFLSADPTVQFPLSTQGFNRYTYTGNNPLSYYDPSGFSWRRVMQVVGIVLSLIPGWGQALGAILKGFIVGFMASGGDFKMAALGGIGGGLFSGIGGLQGLTAFQTAFLHGLAGGALSLAAGGRFGEGFFGSFAGSFGSARLARSNSFREGAGVAGDGDALGMIKRTAVAAVIGGTVSRLSGGKFENGAVTAAFAHLFNDEEHRGRSTPETRRANVDAAVAYARREGLVGEFTYDYVDEYVRLERRADGKDVVVRCKDARCDGRGGAGAMTNTETGHVTFFRASAEVPVGVVHWVDPVTPKVTSTMDRHVYAFTDIRSGFEHALFVTAHEYWHVRTKLGASGDPTLQHLEWRANLDGANAIKHFRNR